MNRAILPIDSWQKLWTFGKGCQPPQSCRRCWLSLSTQCYQFDKNQVLKKKKTFCRLFLLLVIFFLSDGYSIICCPIVPLYQPRIECSQGRHLCGGRHVWSSRWHDQGWISHQGLFLKCVILYLRMKCLGGSSKRLESKLRRGPVYFSKGKEVERRILKMNRLSFSIDVSNIFDSIRSYNIHSIQVVLPELAVLRLQIH